MIFQYTERETAYLAQRDPRLGWAIGQIGPFEREVDPDLFSSVVHHIIGQQISTAAQKTIWDRLRGMLGSVCADTLCALQRDALQGIGISYRKADYILDFAGKVQCGVLNLQQLWSLPDAELIQALCQIRGIGVWTAEMILTFCMQRPDVVSFGDLAILRGMRMLYRHRRIDRAKFDRYRRRYAPCGTVASLYLWAISGGAIPGLTDPAPKGRKA